MIDLATLKAGDLISELIHTGIPVYAQADFNSPKVQNFFKSGSGSKMYVGAVKDGSKIPKVVAGFINVGLGDCMEMATKTVCSFYGYGWVHASQVKLAGQTGTVATDTGKKKEDTGQKQSDGWGLESKYGAGSGISPEFGLGLLFAILAGLALSKNG